MEQKRILSGKKKNVPSDSDEASSDSGNADSSSAESEEAGPSQANQDTYRFGADDDSDDDILTVKKGPQREVPGDSLSEVNCLAVTCLSFNYICFNFGIANDIADKQCVESFSTFEKCHKWHLL